MPMRRERMERLAYAQVHARLMSEKKEEYHCGEASETTDHVEVVDREGGSEDPNRAE